MRRRLFNAICILKLQTSVINQLISSGLVRVHSIVPGGLGWSVCRLHSKCHLQIAVLRCHSSVRRCSVFPVDHLDTVRGEDGGSTCAVLLYKQYRVVRSHEKVAVDLFLSTVPKNAGQPFPRCPVRAKKAHVLQPPTSHRPLLRRTAAPGSKRLPPRCSLMHSSSGCALIFTPAARLLHVVLRLASPTRTSPPFLLARRVPPQRAAAAGEERN